MQSYTDKIFIFRKKSEEGFVLIAAIMAVMILIAVGFFALTVTTQDIRISSRLVGERSALSAAEAGIHEISKEIKKINDDTDLDALEALYQNKAIDPTNDPTAKISYDVGIITDTLTSLEAEPGMPSEYKAKIYRILVTGEDTRYGSTATVETGAAGVFGPGTPIYTNPGD